MQPRRGPYLLGSLEVEARPAHNKPECTNRTKRCSAEKDRGQSATGSIWEERASALEMKCSQLEDRAMTHQKNLVLYKLVGIIYSWGYCSNEFQGGGGGLEEVTTTGGRCENSDKTY